MEKRSICSKGGDNYFVSSCPDTARLSSVIVLVPVFDFKIKSRTLQKLKKIESKSGEIRW